MISYEPFWQTLLKKGVTTCELIYKHGVPANTIHRMKHNFPITTKTLDLFCEILDCDVGDIIKHCSG